jgi:uncharacterized protein (DUF1697 family)
MPVLVAMLRGVNLGSARRIKMEELRAVYESLGLRAVRTHLQSGNAIFQCARGIAAARLEGAFEKRFGFRSEVYLRTPDELREVVARNPFPGAEGSKLGVYFLAEDPGEEARRKALALETPAERLHAEGRELYVYFSNGMARPRLNMAAVGKALGGSGTMRNWNTVVKLLEIAENL